MSAAAVVLAATLSSAPALRAQAATASLRVLVTDDTGARVEGASLVVGGPDGARDGTTDAQGQATLLHLRPGRYHVRVEKLGLHADARVLVGAGGTTRITVQVVPAGASEARARAVAGRPFDHGTLVDDEALHDFPRPSDPWSIVRDAPGVVLDRVDVGGSDTAQPSLVISRGDPGTGATWQLDGVDVTDPAAVGASAVYPDIDALALVEVRTSGLDVRVRTPGAQIGLFTRELAPRWSGRVHARATGPQSENVPADLLGRPLVRNTTERGHEVGAELGGPLGGDLFWIWAAMGRTALRQQTFTGHQDSLRTTSFTARGRARAGRGTLSLLGLRAEKVDEDRDVTVSASAESRWRQSGPAWLAAAEDRRPLGPVSLLTRISFLDTGFRLEPRGGAGASAFEDFRGVFQRSYQQFDTRRPRFEAGAEAAAVPRWKGFDHVLVAGGSYRRSVVTTDARWPGNGVVAFERQSVFFRAFGLTGFALPTRAQSARSVLEGWSGYVQDEARRGRLGLTAGFRLDHLAGRNLSSSVEANPAFPDLLPAARYGGGDTEIEWLDLLPRVGVSWDLAREGRLVARAGYAAYAAPLGSGDVTFDSPIGREGASLTYYWIDRDGDHTVDAGELDPVRGLLGASGVDPAAPALAVSPHAIEAGLRAPRTHEVTAALESGAAGGLQAALHLTWRRLTDSLWRPLRGLTVFDYVARGGVRGLLFGETYDVGFYAPASLSRLVPGDGRLLANRQGYRQDVWSADVAAAGRLGSHVEWRASATVSDWREFFPDATRSVQDPTPTDVEPLKDAGRVAVRAGGLGRGDVFASARWTASGSLRATLPWRLAAATRLYARDGFPIPYFQIADTGDPTNAAKNVLLPARIDRFRLPALFLADVRVDRTFAVGPGRLTAAVNVFNVLNRATTLQVARDIEAPSFGRPREILRPRIARLDLEYRF